MPLREKIEISDQPISDTERVRIQALEAALTASGSKVIDQKLLILVDLQGMYLALHNWLSSRCEILNDGFLLSQFAHLQLQRTVAEVSRRLARRSHTAAGYIGDLYEKIKIEKKQDQYFLAENIRILKDATYFFPSVDIEIFYAPAPLREISWHLRKQFRNRNYQNSLLAEKVDAGIISRHGLFERDYSVYDAFVEELKRINEVKRSHEGFFNFLVNDKGLKYFDEKEVDTRIVMRAMEAIILNQVDAICVVSSDQDFLPLEDRTKTSDVEYFQADLAKFLKADRTGRRLEKLGDKFIAGGIDPEWPLEILTQAMTVEAFDHHAKFGLDDAEVDLLVELHNEMNEVQIKLLPVGDGGVEIVMSRPA